VITPIICRTCLDGGMQSSERPKQFDKKGQAGFQMADKNLRN